MLNRRNALAALIASAMAEGSPAAESGEWKGAVFTAADGQTRQEAAGVVATIYHDGPTGMLKDMTAGFCDLEPGQEPHPPHQHPEEEFMLITEGTGEILVGGKQHAAGPGSLMFAESNSLHGIRNTGTSRMRFYFFKWQAS